jgi:hypothetical protein
MPDLSDGEPLRAMPRYEPTAPAATPAWENADGSCSLDVGRLNQPPVAPDFVGAGQQSIRLGSLTRLVNGQVGQ